MTSPVQLYMFYVGGNAGRSTIEVHDIQFAAVDHHEAAWPLLRSAWFGDPDKLHVDGYSIITWADGYDVTLARTPSRSPSHLPCTGAQRLFFVNVGAYRPDTLAEQHAFDLFVAPDAATAKARALAVLLPGSDHQHKDNLRAVDDCLALTQVGGWHVQLRANPDGVRVQPAWQGYQPIGLGARRG